MQTLHTQTNSFEKITKEIILIAAKYANSKDSFKYLSLTIVVNITFETYIYDNELTHTDSNYLSAL